MATFKKGDTAFYPHHGAGHIIDVYRRDGVRYIKFKPLDTSSSSDNESPSNNSLVLHIPADRASEVGLRPLLDPEEVDDLFEVMRERNIRLPSNWSRRFKNHQEKLKTGDPFEMAEVVRNLATRPKLSVAERDLLFVARRILSSELRLIFDMDDEQVSVLLDEVLA